MLGKSISSHISESDIIHLHILHPYVPRSGILCSIDCTFFFFSGFSHRKRFVSSNKVGSTAAHNYTPAAQTEHIRKAVGEISWYIFSISQNSRNLMWPPVLGYTLSSKTSNTLTAQKLQTFSANFYSMREFLFGIRCSDVRLLLILRASIELVSTEKRGKKWQNDKNI